MSDLQELSELWAVHVGQDSSEDEVWRRVHLVHEDGSDEVLFLSRDGKPAQVKRTAEEVAWQRECFEAEPERCLTVLRAAQIDKKAREYKGVAVVMPEAEAAIRKRLIDGGLIAMKSGFFETYSTAKGL
ncbi:hypothetical protein ACFQ6C_25960 [Streptomyces sp. NPDC056454]|uniref:hypothetical protein n=1 Tax=Streptomyces sp. NPDC056454 TaxID=3345823 RepID=UPI00367B1057